MKKCFCWSCLKLWTIDRKTQFFKYSKRETHLSLLRKNKIFEETGTNTSPLIQLAVHSHCDYITSNKRESLLIGEPHRRLLIIIVKCPCQGSHIHGWCCQTLVVCSVYLSACHHSLAKTSRWVINSLCSLYLNNHSAHWNLQPSPSIEAHTSFSLTSMAFQDARLGFLDRVSQHCFLGEYHLEFFL